MCLALWGLNNIHSLTQSQFAFVLHCYKKIKFNYNARAAQFTWPKGRFPRKVGGADNTNCAGQAAELFAPPLQRIVITINARRPAGHTQILLLLILMNTNWIRQAGRGQRYVLETQSLCTVVWMSNVNSYEGYPTAGFYSIVQLNIFSVTSEIYKVIYPLFLLHMSESDGLNHLNLSDRGLVVSLTKLWLSSFSISFNASTKHRHSIGTCPLDAIYIVTTQWLQLLHYPFCYALYLSRSNVLSDRS